MFYRFLFATIRMATEQSASRQAEEPTLDQAYLIIDSLLHDAMERVEDEDVDGFSLKLIEGLNLLRDDLSKVVENTTSKRFSRLDKTVLDIKKQLNNPTSPPVASSTSGRSYTSVAALPIYRRPPIPPYAPAILLRP